MKEWKERPGNKDRHKKNVERFKKNHPLYGRDYYATHKAQSQENRRTQHAKRSARKRGLPDSYTVEDWRFALEYFNDCCAVCGRPQGLWHTLAQDHWIPLSNPECPGTVPENIVPLCHVKKDGEGSCNIEKHNSDPMTWLTKKYGARKAKKIVQRVEAYFEVVRQRQSVG